jgi:hypothetical protein
MKVTVTGDKPQVKEIDWTKQCLVRSINTGTIVMVTGEVDTSYFAGVVVYFNKGRVYNNLYDTAWLKDKFELLPENVEITLSNKSE